MTIPNCCSHGRRGLKDPLCSYRKRVNCPQNDMTLSKPKLALALAATSSFGDWDADVDATTIRLAPNIEIESGRVGGERYESLRIRLENRPITIEDLRVGDRRYRCETTDPGNGITQKSCR
jgi:hypothetical protein